MSNWDTSLGIATSLLHRFGIDESHDPYNLIETLPLNPGGQVNVDMLRRRLLAYLTDAGTIRERFKNEAGGPPPYWLIVLDDVHHIEESSAKLLGAILQISQNSPLRIIMISRKRPAVYDRRDVHTRDMVSELSLKGLSKDELETWLEELEIQDDVESIYQKTEDIHLPWSCLSCMVNHYMLIGYSLLTMRYYSSSQRRTTVAVRIGT